MKTENTTNILDDLRGRIAQQVRALRRERRWTQAELAEQLGLSQSRLSEIERGAGSFTAEQLLLMLARFNVPASRFVGEAGSREAVLQNALARLGARQLQESDDVIPSGDLEHPRDVVREALLEGVPRLHTALAPVLVRNIDRLNLSGLHMELHKGGRERRLGWVAESTVAALERELAGASPRAWAQLCRRAGLVLSTFLETISAAHASSPAIPPDVFDPTIRSRKTLEEVKAASSPIARKWGVVTRLQTEDFAEALRATRDDS